MNNYQFLSAPNLMYTWECLGPEGVSLVWNLGFSMSFHFRFCLTALEKNAIQNGKPGFALEFAK